MATIKKDIKHYPVRFRSMEQMNFTLFGEEKQMMSIYDLVFKTKFGTYIRHINVYVSNFECEHIHVHSYDWFNRKESKWINELVNFPLFYEIKSMKVTLLIGAHTGLELADPDSEDYPVEKENIIKDCWKHCPCIGSTQYTIRGLMYEPYDNSFCIKISGKVSNNRHDNRYYITQNGYHDEIEDGATFIIISEPYEQVTFHDEVSTRTFINVISTKTGNIYRTKYLPTAIKHN